jgi:hypothetical protein
VRELKLEEFSGVLGETFTVESEAGPVSFELTAVQPLSLSLYREDAFRLEWTGPREPLLPQAIYRMSRDGEAYEIFLVPIAQDQNTTRYEAIFN